MTEVDRVELEQRLASMDSNIVSLTTETRGMKEQVARQNGRITKLEQSEREQALMEAYERGRSEALTGERRREDAQATQRRRELGIGVAAFGVIVAVLEVVFRVLG